MSVYTGITVGPVVGTLQLTSSPAGLWAASSLFSDLTARTLRELCGLGVPVEDLISPVVTEENGEIVLPSQECEKLRSIGVGMFHDRIILCGAYAAEAALAARHVKQELAEMLRQTDGIPLRDPQKLSEWIDAYFRIYVLEQDVPEGVSPILRLGRLLSAAELEPTFPIIEENNPLLWLFENVEGGPPYADGFSTGGRNRAVRRSYLVSGLKGRWMLRSDASDSIRDIGSIAAGGSADGKATQYFAILNSDGDSMTSVLETLTGPDEIRAYSKKCLQFCAEAAGQILAFSGVPIYAGGDDLLCLLPLTVEVDGEDRSIFWLIDELRSIFNRVFTEERGRFDGKPSISFGLSVQHKKSPLFEALETARQMLDSAKSGSGEKKWPKNAMRMTLRKHSGQQCLLGVDMLDFPLTDFDSKKTQLSEMDKLLRQLKLGGTDSEGIECLNSLVYKLESAYRPLFLLALEQAPEQRGRTIRSLFDNLFDNVGQQKYQKFRCALAGLTEQLADTAAKVRAVVCCGQNESIVEPVFSQLTALLRVLHFMLEKKEGQNDLRD